MKRIFLIVVCGFIIFRIQGQVLDSRHPGSLQGTNEVRSTAKVDARKKPKFDWWAAQRAFSQRQKKGRTALQDFDRGLENEQIAYHQRMIYQIKQARKLERRNRNKRFANPNYCYPPGRFALKRKFRK